MTYIFLTPNNDESGESGETKYFAIPADKIERLNLFETYDRNGQEVGHDNAGDGLTLLTAKAVELANKFYHENHAEYDDDEILNHYSVDDYLSAYKCEFDQIIASKDLGDEDYSTQFSTCKGFDYWDGHNWKTVVTEYEFHGEPSHNIVDDEELVAELNEAIENMEFVSEGFGHKNYEAGRWDIVDSQWQGTWASYILREKDA